MKRDTFQRKRRPTRGRTFVLHSKTSRRKKQRVAAGAAANADLGSEVPNLGVARALFVILILHVAAVAAIFIHNKVTEDDPVEEKSALRKEAEAIAAFEEPRPVSALPPAQPGETIHHVETGETYESIAAAEGVSVIALRELNNHRRLRAGNILRVPAVAAPPAQAESRDPVAALPDRPVDSEPVGVEQITQRDMRPVVVNDPAPAAPPSGPGGEGAESGAGRAVIVDPDQESYGAVVVKPRRNPLAAVNSAGGTEVGNGRDASSASGSGQSYKVRSGDTVWAIARRFRTTPDKLLSANGIKDPRKLQVGMTLKIPAN